MINRILTFFLVLSTLTADAQHLNKKIKDQYINREIMLNRCDREHLVSFPEFKEIYHTEYAAYTLNDSLVKTLKPLLSEKEITIVLGTWCGDSKLQVPRFIKILDALGFQEQQLILIGVDAQKKAENGLIDHLNIERVPTFIISAQGKELGRITESPKETLEQDLLNILKK